MKKALIILTLMALGVSTAFGGSILYETHIEDSLNFEGQNIYEVLELEFTTDQPSIVSITYGWSIGYAQSCRLFYWLTCNGDSLVMTTSLGQFTSTYMTELESGTYTLGLMGYFGYLGGYVINPRLQVLILYNDSVPSVSETPPQPTPTENPSIISCGPSVTVPGCSEVVDIAGRKVDCEINDDRIMINSLSSGTYFAKTNNNRVVKITKLQ